MRQGIKIEIPLKWEENKKKGLCPVCGKSKEQFDKYMKKFFMRIVYGRYWEVVVISLVFFFVGFVVGTFLILMTVL